MYLCIYVSMYTCIYIHTYIYIYVCMYACISLSLSIYIYIYMCMCIYIYIYICITMRLHYIYIYIYIYIFIHTYSRYMPPPRTSRPRRQLRRRRPGHWSAVPLGGRQDAPPLPGHGGDRSSERSRHAPGWRRDDRGRELVLRRPEGPDCLLPREPARSGRRHRRAERGRRVRLALREPRGIMLVSMIS